MTLIKPLRQSDAVRQAELRDALRKSNRSALEAHVALEIVKTKLASLQERQRQLDTQLEIELCRSRQMEASMALLSTAYAEIAGVVAPQVRPAAAHSRTEERMIGGKPMLVLSNPVRHPDPR